MEQIQTNVAVPLSKNKRNMILWGCVFIMVYMTMSMSGLSVLQSPILESMNAMHLFSLLSILAALGMGLLNPIGGKLGDLFGRRNTVLYSGVIVAISTVLLSLVTSPVLFLVFRFILSAGIGAITSAPSIILREIFPSEEVPKTLGLLSSGMAIGNFSGAGLAGMFSDLGLHRLAILFPILPLIIGTALIVLNFPAAKRTGKVSLDGLGVLFLSITLTSLLFTMNSGGRYGWGHPLIIAGFGIAIIGFFLLLNTEKKVAEPIIPLHLFKNKKYVALLVVGFFSYFYTTALNTYAPLAVQKILHQPVAISGTLQMPRTIVTIILPALAGVWVGKKRSHSWQAMAINALLVGVSYLALGFTTAQTPLMVFFIAIAITGVGESFRSVSITPAAQETLLPHDIGIGTALVTFINTLSGLFSSATTGILFDSQKDMTSGINAVFIFSGIVSLIGLLVILLVVRKQQMKN